MQNLVDLSECNVMHSILHHGSSVPTGKTDILHGIFTLKAMIVTFRYHACVTVGILLQCSPPKGLTRPSIQNLSYCSLAFTRQPNESYWPQHPQQTVVPRLLQGMSCTLSVWCRCDFSLKAKLVSILTLLFCVLFCFALFFICPFLLCVTSCLMEGSGELKNWTLFCDWS